MSKPSWTRLFPLFLWCSHISLCKRSINNPFRKKHTTVYISLYVTTIRQICHLQVYSNMLTIFFFSPCQNCNFFTVLSWVVICIKSFFNQCKCFYNGLFRNLLEFVFSKKRLSFHSSHIIIHLYFCPIDTCNFFFYIYEICENDCKKST